MQHPGFISDYLPDLLSITTWKVLKISFIKRKISPTFLKRYRKVLFFFFGPTFEKPVWGFFLCSKTVEVNRVSFVVLRVFQSGSSLKDEQQQHILPETINICVTQRTNSEQFSEKEIFPMKVTENMFHGNLWQPFWLEVKKNNTVLTLLQWNFFDYSVFLLKFLYHCIWINQYFSILYSSF